MTTFILFIALRVNSGGIIQVQEFSSQETCEAAVTKLYKVNETAQYGLKGFEAAWCIAK